jgi:ornithine--oxo-acid transaminase
MATRAALEVIQEEHLTQRARELGDRFRAAMQALIDRTDRLVLVRGRGLLNAVVVNDSPDSSTAWNLCMALAENGLLAKPTHGNIIRFAPPLVLTDAQMDEAIGIIERTVEGWG